MDNDKVKGKANQGMGDIKERIGGATDNEDMERDGQKQQIKGKGQEALGNVKDESKEVKERLS
jgi:uncharacterized protein YjbJ (UPF0337 family)